MYTHREPSAWHREQTGVAESHRMCRERHGIQAFETRFAGRDFCSLIVLVTINTRSIKQENELIKPKGSRMRVLAGVGSIAAALDMGFYMGSIPD
jgi:hypothetical protein